MLLLLLLLSLLLGRIAELMLNRHRCDIDAAHCYIRGVVYVSVCLCMPASVCVGRNVSPTETDEPIKMPFVM